MAYLSRQVLTQNLHGCCRCSADVTSSRLCHDADQLGVIERVGGRLGSAAPVVDRASEGSTSVSRDADGLVREQGSTAWSDRIENINAGMLLASNHVPKQANSILMMS